MKNAFALIAMILVPQLTNAADLKCSDIDPKTKSIVVKNANFKQADRLSGQFFTCIAQSKEFTDKLAAVTPVDSTCKVKEGRKVVLNSTKVGRPDNTGETGNYAAYMYGQQIVCDDVGTGLFSGVFGTAWAVVNADHMGRLCLDKDDKDCKESDQVTLTLTKIVTSDDLTDGH